MKIIIVGCGKVGSTLAELLSAEQHDITVIDTDQSKVEQLSEDLDVMGLFGNGASIDVMTEADLEHTDILIAVTGSDETNLLICLMAKNVGHCETIARVRNPMYNREIDFIRAQMGISMVINPELATANEIYRLLRFPAAVDIDSFEGGRVYLFKILIEKNSPLHCVKVKDLSTVCRCDVLLCAVERDDDVSIPGGDFTLYTGDMISVIASEENMVTFFRHLGMSTKPVANALIVGGGTTGFYLARRLMDAHIRVRIIDNDPRRCRYLSDLLPDASIILGDGTDRKLLQEEGIAGAESFVSLTNMDEENILLGLYARKHSKAKTVTKVDRVAFDEIVNNMDLGSVIYPKYITADYILQYVRAQQNSVGNNIRTLCRILDDRVEAIEFAIHETSPVVGIPLMELNLKPNELVCCIMRDGKVLIPRGSDCIRIGDSVIIITLEKGLRDICDILQE